MLFPPSLNAVSPADTESKAFRLERHGDRDMVFDGWLIGYADDEISHSKISVEIYCTTRNAVVVRACRRQRVQRRVEGELEDAFESECGVEVFDADTVEYYPHKIIAWMKQDTRGKLGPISKQAWELACRNWSMLSGEEAERV